jgi:hypothetical protein
MLVLPRTSIFRLRQRSILRAIVLALGAFAISLRMAGFPYIEELHSSAWQFLPTLAILWAILETARCLGRKWSLYHAGVLILLWTDLMILTLAVILWIYP